MYNDITKHEINKKLEGFLEDKITKICRETQEIKEKLNLSYIKMEKSFEIMKIKDDFCYGYCFYNKNDFRCFLFIYKDKGIDIKISINNISSRRLNGNISALYRCMDEINKIAEELQHLKYDLEKKIGMNKKLEKITEITKTSINTWIKTVMQNQSYSYYITESEKKITLSIKLKNRTQLDIPIYFSRFQKIMSNLLETIQQFENTTNNSKNKVLITNSKINQKWTIN